MINVIEILFYLSIYASLFVSIFWFTTYYLNYGKSAPPRIQIKSLCMVIPSYNSERHLENCVKSLIDQNYPRLKIVIVDDGSTDNTRLIAERLAKMHSNVRYIKKPHGGKASSLNYILKNTRTELFGFIDADTMLEKGALQNMVNYMHGKCAAVIASIKPYRPKNMIEKLQNVEYIISSLNRKLMSFLDSLYYTPGFAIYKTDILKRIGGFDENNITEDLEIGLRIKSKGYNIESSSGDIAYTAVPATFSGLFRQRMRWYRGYFYNTKKYSTMFFNRKYKDMGLFVLPVQYILLFLITSMFLVAIFDSVINVARMVIDIYIIGFDLDYLISRAGLTIITTNTFFIIVTAAAFFAMIRISEKSLRGTIGKLDYIVYIAIYPIINTILWLSAFAYEVMGTKKEW